MKAILIEKRKYFFAAIQMEYKDFGKGLQWYKTENVIDDFLTAKEAREYAKENNLKVISRKIYLSK